PATNTAAPPAATATSAPPPSPTAVSVAASPTFVIPTAIATPVPGVVAMAALVQSPAGSPDYTPEVQAYFALFYKARTLAPGGQFDLSTITNLTAPPYRDYTLALLNKNQADADAGKLRQVSYSDVAVIGVTLDAPGADGKPVVAATIHRTQTQVRTDSTVSPETLDLQFLLKRTDLGNGQVAWQAFDFFNPAANAWLSDLARAAAVTTAQIGPEIQDYFTHFYTARSVSAQGQFDFATTQGLTALAYQQYTLPLLQQQQAEVDAGRVTGVSYSGISVRVESWDPLATSHGGIALAAVTRTSHVQRPGQPEEIQTATYHFRLHRHVGDDGKPFWIAYDFLSPISGKWVSDSAGMSGQVPEPGHG
ncbi:MAG TPA: hypothetical protein VKY74_15805, partial [Chloroflexia bacterium]|nr:hypothetical protein [Chloroflexia bacterium]